MILPTLKKELHLFSQGYNRVAGVDEAGRGAWAGPIVAGVVIITPDKIKIAKNYDFVRDSKTLTPKARLRAYYQIRENFESAVGLIDSLVIDEQGLTYANQEAMNYAFSNIRDKPDFILVDGRGFAFENNFENIIDGDSKIFCISAASIVAKVARDFIMKEFHNIFSGFSFHKHKGYGTKLHQEMLNKYGASPIHRKSFKPIKMLLTK